MSFGVIIGIIGKVLVNMGVKLLAEEFIEDILLLLAEKGVRSTKTKVDDELFEKIKKQLRPEG